MMMMLHGGDGRGGCGDSCSSGNGMAIVEAGL